MYTEIRTVPLVGLVTGALLVLFEQWAQLPALVVAVTGAVVVLRMVAGVSPARGRRDAPGPW